MVQYYERCSCFKCAFHTSFSSYLTISDIPCFLLSTLVSKYHIPQNLRVRFHLIQHGNSISVAKF